MQIDTSEAFAYVSDVQMSIVCTVYSKTCLACYVYLATVRTLRYLLPMSLHSSWAGKGEGGDAAGDDLQHEHLAKKIIRSLVMQNSEVPEGKASKGSPCLPKGVFQCMSNFTCCL